MGEDENFLKHLKKMTKYDELAVAAFGLNIFAIYSMANIRDLQDILEPFATDEIMLIQISALMAGIYLLEYMGDDDGSSHDPYSTGGDDGEGIFAMISGLMENGTFGTIVDAASLGVVFLGYQYLAENVGRNVSLFEISLTPEVLAMQISVLMMLNFGIVLIGDLMSKAN